MEAIRQLRGRGSERERWLKAALSTAGMLAVCGALVIGGIQNEASPIRGARAGGIREGGDGVGLATSDVSSGSLRGGHAGVVLLKHGHTHAYSLAATRTARR